MLRRHMKTMKHTMCAMSVQVLCILSLHLWQFSNEILIEKVGSFLGCRQTRTQSVISPPGTMPQQGEYYLTIGLEHHASHNPLRVNPHLPNMPNSRSQCCRSRQCSVPRQSMAIFGLYWRSPAPFRWAKGVRQSLAGKACLSAHFGLSLVAWLWKLCSHH